MESKINIGDLGEFSGRTTKKVKVLRVDDKYVTYLILDENKKKCIKEYIDFINKYEMKDINYFKYIIKIN